MDREASQDLPATLKSYKKFQTDIGLRKLNSRKVNYNILVYKKISNL
jgi:hypothetical protein